MDRIEMQQMATYTCVHIILEIILIYEKKLMSDSAERRLQQ
jgi:hypothetical protein